jgi:phage terminase large subunit-like protein
VTVAGAKLIRGALRPYERERASSLVPLDLYEHQRPPAGLGAGALHLWLILAGRGAGKTSGCAAYFDGYMREHPGTRGAIIGPTVGDAIESCVDGPLALRALNPTLLLRTSAGGTHVTWPNGSTAKLFGAYTREDVERLRAGGNRELAWVEELATWRHLEEAWAQMEFGLRLGEYPHVIGSTTPKPRPFLRKLIAREDVHVTRATIFDNPRLPESQKAVLLDLYEGTRLGRQELLGELIEEVEGALWTYELIAQTRVSEHPELTRCVVAVDPSGGDEEGNDEQGIIVAGLGVDGEAYVLADRSCKLSPNGWGRRAVQAWEDYDADRIVCETNYGGDMVVANVRAAANDRGVSGLRVVKLSASRGKQLRAEPVAALYEQKRVHHVGVFEGLEYQMTQWSPEAGWSPDRLDSVVFVVSELLLGRPRKRMRIE